MYIESVQLKDFRNYDSLELKLTEGRIYFMGITHRERQIFWKQSTSAERVNLIKEVRIRR